MHSAAHSGIREWLHGAFVYASPLLDSLTKSAHFIESIEPKKRLISGASLIACPRALQGHAKREGEREMAHGAFNWAFGINCTCLSLPSLALPLVSSRRASRLSHNGTIRHLLMGNSICAIDTSNPAQRFTA